MNRPPDNEDEPVRLHRSYHPPCSCCGRRHSPFQPCPVYGPSRTIPPWIFPLIVTLGILAFTAALYIVSNHKL
jgi:hypothetical protein